MAKLIGLDVRHRTVRAVLLSTSYRKTTLEALSEVDLWQFGSPEQAVQACLVGIVPHADAVAVAVDGSSAFIHRIQVPAAAEKQLAEVIPFELEAHVPVEVESLVHDWLMLPRASSSDPITVLAAAVRKEKVKETIELVSRAAGREAERVGVGALPLANLGPFVPEIAGDACTAILELGDDQSEFVVLRRSTPLFARSISIGVSGLPQSAPELAARLRQTIAAAVNQTGLQVTTVFLTGGGSAAAGAEAYLSSELRVPVVPLPVPTLDGLTDDKLVALPRFARALGLALGLRGRPRDLDLRRGSLSYQRGFAFLKERAPLLGSLGGVILLSFFFATWAELRSLGHEHEVLAGQLAKLSKEALGEESEDPDHVRELLDSAGARAETDPMPHMDGFDVMVELSKAVPVGMVHDVEELDLAREHVKIRGIVGSAAEAQQIADGLKKNACFTDVKITKVSQVVNETRQKYVLESEIKCPEDAVAKKKAETEEGEKQ